MHGLAFACRCRGYLRYVFYTTTFRGCRSLPLPAARSAHATHCCVYFLYIRIYAGLHLPLLPVLISRLNAATCLLLR